MATTLFAGAARTRAAAAVLHASSPALLTQQRRSLHNRIPAPPIPSPTAFVPDAPTFLSLIGRNLATHASKIPTWEALFSLTSAQLRDVGVEPPRARRYLLRWREKFRRGEFGPGGDAGAVEGGRAVVRVVEVPVAPGDRATMATATMEGGMRKVALNGGEVVRGVRVKGAQTVVGRQVVPVKGERGAGVIAVREGLWEVRRGRKIDGGERRQAEVRAKRRGEERKAQR